MFKFFKSKKPISKTLEELDILLYNDRIYFNKKVYIRDSVSVKSILSTNGWKEGFEISFNHSLYTMYHPDHSTILEIIPKRYWKDFILSIDIANLTYYRKINQIYETIRLTKENIL